MPMTDSRSGYAARLQTRYMNTTGMCAELYFKATFTSVFDMSLVSIIAVNEDNNKALLNNNYGWEPSSLWTRMFAILPPGINQVMIEGRRSNVGLCSLAIDDIAIRQCIHFGNVCSQSVGYLLKIVRLAL